MDAVLAWTVFVVIVVAAGWIGLKAGKWNLRRMAKAKERQWQHEADMDAWQYNVKAQRLRDRGLL